MSKTVKVNFQIAVNTWLLMKLVLRVCVCGFNGRARVCVFYVRSVCTRVLAFISLRL